MTVKFFAHKEDDSGHSGANVDPSYEHVLVPEPDPGFVRIPIIASIQADGLRPFTTCHALLNPTNVVGGVPVFEPGVDVTWQNQNNVRNALIYWSAKLTPAVMQGGEYFLPVPVFPIFRGLNILASWSYVDGAIRTRCFSVQVPLAEFDWSKAQWPLGFQSRHTTV